ncbi:MAG: hypothetical protein ACWGOL_07655 [Desulfuromonadales bacterium]
MMLSFATSRMFAQRNSRSAFLIVISVLLIMMTGACGKKGPVLPRLDRPVMPPEEVSLQQQGNFFVLSWKIPATDRLGVSEQDLIGFRIDRLIYDPVEGCPTCRDPKTEVAELDLRHLHTGERINQRVFWRDLDILPGKGYRYAIVPLILGGQEGPAATIHLAAQQPPPSPTGLQATAGDARISLQWVAPVLPAEMQLVGYNLYRRHSKLPFPVIPVNGKPLQETHLLDRGLDNDRSYAYRVTAVVRKDDQLLESIASPEAVATPRTGL